MRIILVRHGQVAENREMRYVGKLDSELTELGQEQAAAVGGAVAELAPTAIRSSPLKRCVATAEEICRSSALELALDERLREQSFGTWEGMSREEVRARSEEDAECLQAFDSHPSAAPPDGESLENVQARAVGLVEELAASKAETVALVSHVGPIKALFAAALDIPLIKARRMFLDPATISVVDWGNPSYVRLFNSHSHLGWSKARWIEHAVRIH